MAKILKDPTLYLEVVTEEELKAELKRRADVRAKEKERLDQLYSIEMLKLVDNLLFLATHSRTSCMDENPCNAWVYRHSEDGYGGGYVDTVNCTRCALLEIKATGAWPSNLTFELRLTERY